MAELIKNGDGSFSTTKDTWHKGKAKIINGCMVATLTEVCEFWPNFRIAVGVPVLHNGKPYVISEVIDSCEATTLRVIEDDFFYGFFTENKLPSLRKKEECLEVIEVLATECLLDLDFYMYVGEPVSIKRCYCV